MRDGPVRRALKRLARLEFEARLRLRRRLRPPPFVLGGACQRCALCCEAPSLTAPRLVWSWPLLRAAFLAWQEHVNGFVLAGHGPRRTFVFRCTHFDPATRSCDSYDSRPAVCRDYPRGLLDEPAPTFLPGCGFRAVARNAEALRKALDAAGIDDEKKARAVDQLRLR